MLLYKYTTTNTAFQILFNNKFRYTQPIAFNDPFEVSPIAQEEVDISIFENDIKRIMSTPELVDQFMEKSLVEMFNSLEDTKKANISFDDFKKSEINKFNNDIEKLGRSIENEFTARFQKMMPFLTNSLMYLLPRQLGLLTGVFCLSEKNDNVLMWSHYADSHFGLVIEIDSNNEFFKNLKAVNYSNNRPVINIIKVYKKDLSDSERIQYTKDIFFTKSEDWKYETEYRDVRILSYGEKTNIRGEFGFPVVLFKYPIEIIKGVIFGSKWGKEEREAFYKLMEGTGYNIDYKQATLDKQLFKINIEPFNPK